MLRAEYLTALRVQVFENREYKKDMKIIHAWVKRLDSDLKAFALAEKLRQYWPIVPQSLLLQHANEDNINFLRLMVWILENGGQVTPSVMIQWWRRMRALRQDHLITYIRQANLLARIKENPEVSPEIIMGLCFESEESLRKFNASWTDPRSVLLSFCEFIGASTSTDIKVYWKHWVAKNHPDKGGDERRFALANEMYHELMGEHYEDC